MFKHHVINPSVLSLMVLGILGCQVTDDSYDTRSNKELTAESTDISNVGSHTSSHVHSHHDSKIDSNTMTTHATMGQEDTINTLYMNFDTISTWYTINDNVMGGISEGSMQQENAGIGLFKGKLSLKNRGGFSSVRTPIDPLVLVDAKGLTLRVRGEEGRQFTLLVSSQDTQGSWQKDFMVSSEWKIIHISFDTMQLYVRGWIPPSSPPVNPQNVNAIGLMIKDKNEDIFYLEIDWIRANYSN